MRTAETCEETDGRRDDEAPAVPAEEAEEEEVDVPASVRCEEEAGEAS